MDKIMEKNSKLPRYMWYTRTSLKFVGLWPVSREESVKKSNLKETVNASYFVVVAFGFILRASQMFVNCCINYTNFESAAESIGPMMALVISFGKMCIYRHHRARLARLVCSLEESLRNGPSDVLNYLEAYARIGGLACGSLLAVTWILVLGYLCAPLVKTGRTLPFASWYPVGYSDNSTMLYAMDYFYEVIVTCQGACVMSTEITFVMLTCHCCARFKDLGAKLENLCEERNEHVFSDYIGVRLSSMAKIHCDVLREIEEINRAHTHIVIVLYFAAVIAICCAGLQITSASAPSTTWIILFLVLAMYYAEQLLFYYLPGEMVAGEATTIAFAAYASGWHDFGLENRKIVSLMIMRAHTPPRLLVGQLSPLRLENYSTFLTTTGSYFMSMRAVADA